MRVSAIDMVTPTGLAQSGRFNCLGLANRPKTATQLRGGPYQKANGICAPASDWRHERGLTTNERLRFDMADDYLTPNDISVIRERFHGWERASAKTLAAVFGVSVQRIAAIVHSPTNSRFMRGNVSTGEE